MNINYNLLKRGKKDVFVRQQRSRAILTDRCHKTLVIIKKSQINDSL